MHILLRYFRKLRTSSWELHKIYVSLAYSKEWSWWLQYCTIFVISTALIVSKQVFFVLLRRFKGYYRPHLQELEIPDYTEITIRCALIIAKKDR